MSSFSFADRRVNIKLDGEALDLIPEAKIVDGRTMIPVRGVFENAGLEVGWNGELKAVYVTSNNKKVTLIIDQDIMNDGGKEVKLDVAPKLINGSTYVPIRAIMEAFDVEVGWDNDTFTVILATSERLEEKEEKLIYTLEEIKEAGDVQFGPFMVKVEKLGEQPVAGGREIKISAVATEEIVLEGNYMRAMMNSNELYTGKTANITNKRIGSKEDNWDLLGRMPVHVASLPEKYRDIVKNSYYNSEYYIKFIPKKAFFHIPSTHRYQYYEEIKVLEFRKLEEKEEGYERDELLEEGKEVHFGPFVGSLFKTEDEDYGETNMMYIDPYGDGGVDVEVYIQNRKDLNMIYLQPKEPLTKKYLKASGPFKNDIRPFSTLALELYRLPEEYIELFINDEVGDGYEGTFNIFGIEYYEYPELGKYWVNTTGFTVKEIKELD